MLELTSPHYEIFPTGQNSMGIRALDGKGNILASVEDVSFQKRKLENVVTVYNENGLLLECFEEVTERLIGVLI